MSTKQSILFCILTVSLASAVFMRTKAQTIELSLQPVPKSFGYSNQETTTLIKAPVKVALTSDELTLYNGLMQGKIPVASETYDTKRLQQLYIDLATKLGVDFSGTLKGKDVDLYKAIREK